MCWRYYIHYTYAVLWNMYMSYTCIYTYDWTSVLLDLLSTFLLSAMWLSKNVMWHHKMFNVLCGVCSILGFLRRLNRYIANPHMIIHKKYSSTQMGYFEYSESQIQSDCTKVRHTLPPGQCPTFANDQVLPRNSSMVKLTLKKISNPNQTSANWSPSGSTHFLEGSCFVEWKRITPSNHEQSQQKHLGLSRLVLEQNAMESSIFCLFSRRSYEGNKCLQCTKPSVRSVQNGLGYTCMYIVYCIKQFTHLMHTVRMDMLHMPYILLLCTLNLPIKHMQCLHLS